MLPGKLPCLHFTFCGIWFTELPVYCASFSRILLSPAWIFLSISARVVAECQLNHKNESEQREEQHNQSRPEQVITADWSYHRKVVKKYHVKYKLIRTWLWWRWDNISWQKYTRSNINLKAGRTFCTHTTIPAATSGKQSSFRIRAAFSKGERDANVKTWMQSIKSGHAQK